ncbi:hypothetical protein AAFC00_000426 [Neodothiora populina]|uniref:Mitotic checkpoint regulator, MAD2B-interacting-domain-containing protein n=1 Tax=Neodothiora populina TaxID=2781224 RepID=A0ABR3PE15_9PEZI
MGLVGYSDSEGSDDDAPKAPSPAKTPGPTSTRTAKSGFQKVVDPSGARKIKVDLPTLKPDENQKEDERPAKKARAGTLGGFNSFLPAPKRTAEAKKPGLASGINLRTGAEPAFSRERVEPDLPVATSDTTESQPDPAPAQAPTVAAEEEKPTEVKIVGNAMRFKPLSVANRKPKKKASAIASPDTGSPAPSEKEKVSLFSVTQEEPVQSPAGSVDPVAEYKPLLAESRDTETQTNTGSSTLQQQTQAPQSTNSNSLDALAEDLNLPESARRQLFGRNRNGGNAKIMHFDMEQEYSANELLRQQGQAQEHRAVKAIAPGKHSLQQLVNAASSQKEALEDAWAQGKRNKSEGGSKYGW